MSGIDREAEREQGDARRCGILYVATGRKYVDEATTSAASVKHLHPDLQICVMSDCVVDPRYFDIRLHINSPVHGFMDKIAALKDSPFDRTLFLDSDTVVLSPIDEVFALLDRFEIAVSHEPARFLYSIGNVPDEFPELNTGVILYSRSSEFDALVDEWLRLYRAENIRKEEAGVATWHDQISFTRAVWASRLRLYVLPPEWNYRAPFPQFLCGAVRVFHGRFTGPSSKLSFVNQDSTGRLMNPNPRRLFSIVCNTFRLFKIRKRPR